MPIIQARRLTLLGLLFAAVLGSATSARGQDSVPEFDGFIEPLYDIQLAAGEIGVIQSLEVEVGDAVQAGQTIARLDDQLQQTAVHVAETAAAMHGALDAAQVEYELHRHRTEQIRQLSKEGLTRPDELRRAEADLKMAASRWLAAKEEIAMRHEELEKAKQMLRRRSVTAPMSGVIAQIFRKAGEYVSPTDPDIVRLISDDALVAAVNVPARLAVRVQRGDRVQVVTTVPPQSLTATILTVAPVIDGQSGTIQLRALVQSEGRVCRPGDRCTMRFATRPTQQAQRLPRTVQ
ncbi:efflux RND transporter periplasmic adaptor subunit [Roseimaritima ulvae]|uniref:Macrolide transporter subunit MacA n=1 Tax=Roseimaritima ulvae TaxID=980254 RepID=A0A5B9QVV7_9BACT|nr:efflux RND transporter periplasmic adaptor subunit [Roseimaritima ulvae]QEG38063.1 macrolide transporter subunit MacA [Roseimaritima ulvae]